MSTYTVNTLSDAIAPVAGQLTLRQAVADANAHAGADTIAFDPTVFAAGSLHSIVLQNGPITFTDTSGATTVMGSGSATIAIDGNKTSRVLQVSSGVTVSVSGVTITDGSVNSSAGTLAAGAGVMNDGSLTLSGVTVSNNNLSSAAISTLSESGPYVGGAAEGAGVYSTGTLVLIDSQVSGNIAQGGTSFYGFGGESAGGGVYSLGSLTVTGSALSANNAFGGPGHGGGGEGEGGSIYALGSLTLSASSVTSSKADGGSGINGVGGGANASGGAIFSNGVATLVNVWIDNNVVQGGDAALGDNSDPGGVVFGGGIFSEDYLNISGSTVSGNSVLGGAGDSQDNGPGGNAYGGAIAATFAITIDSTTVSANIATGGSGQANMGLQEALASGGGVYSTASLNVSSSVITGNTAQGAGGSFGYGAAGGVGEGGGISEARYGTAVITSSSITNNKALGGTGDSQNEFHNPFGPGGTGQGGGVFSEGNLTISSSTFYANLAAGGASQSQTQAGYSADGGDGQGGAIDATATLNLINDTLTANLATGGAAGSSQSVYEGFDGGNAVGGGIFYSGFGLSLADSTLTGNQTQGGAAGVIIDGNSALPITPGFAGKSYGGGIADIESAATMKNSIISGNTSDSAFNDLSSSLSSSSEYNLIGAGGGLTNGVNDNKTGINNPLLETLGNYGGPTETMVPLPNSPAVNAGSDALIPAGVTTDQRGYARIVGSSVDIGADELNDSPVSGVVYNDLNGDGLMESGEGGLAGSMIYDDLTNSGYYQSADPSTTTNSYGQYTLNGLPEGTAIIRVTIPAADRQSYPAATAGQTVTVGPAAVTVQNFGLSTKLYVSGKVTFNGVGQGNVLVYADLNNDGKFENTENNKLTNSDGTFSFVSLSAGAYTFRIFPPAGEVQTSPVNNAGITFTLGSGGVDSSVNFTLANAAVSKLIGTVIGTTGSYDNQGNTAANVFDGKLNTFFDAPAASGSYAGLDLGSAKVITQISYAPRSGWASRMVGGTFQASNSSTFTSGDVTFYTITVTPVVGSLTTVSLSNTAAYRYVRYVSPANGYCNIAEAQFFGTSPATPTKLTGTIIGTPGSYRDHGTTIADAFDGNFTTFFDGPDASGDWVGLDLGTAQVVTQVDYAPRVGFEYRMIGGEIQASNSANFSSGVVTLYTISSTPTAGVLTVEHLSNTTAYRYYRYLGPANSYCDIAELEFDG